MRSFNLATTDLRSAKLNTTQLSILLFKAWYLFPQCLIWSNNSKRMILKRRWSGILMVTMWLQKFGLVDKGNIPFALPLSIVLASPSWRKTFAFESESSKSRCQGAGRLLLSLVQENLAGRASGLSFFLITYNRQSLFFKMVTANPCIRRRLKSILSINSLNQFAKFRFCG